MCPRSEGRAEWGRCRSCLSAGFLPMRELVFPAPSGRDGGRRSGEHQRWCLPHEGDCFSDSAAYPSKCLPPPQVCFKGKVCVWGELGSGEGWLVALWGWKNCCCFAGWRHGLQQLPHSHSMHLPLPWQPLLLVGVRVWQLLIISGARAEHGWVLLKPLPRLAQGSHCILRWRDNHGG